MLHSYVDPWGVDFEAIQRREVSRIRQAIATLNAEYDRLEIRYDKLYREQSALPEPSYNDWDEFDVSIEATWDDLYNSYDYKMERIQKRMTAIDHTIFDLEFDLWWKFNKG